MYNVNLNGTLNIAEHGLTHPVLANAFGNPKGRFLKSQRVEIAFPIDSFVILN